jgi:hypothetical protein
LGRLPFEHEQALRLALDELANDLIARPQKRYDQERRTIADPQPNELGRGAQQNGSLVEVRVLRDDRVPVLLRPCPNYAIIGFFEAMALMCVEPGSGIDFLRTTLASIVVLTGASVIYCKSTGS